MANDILPAAGRVALAKSGRDKGRYFVITRVLDGEYVLIADGMTRKVAKPKKKKLKHLSLKPVVLKEIGEKLAAGQTVNDAELKRAIAGTGLIVQKEE